MTPAPDVAVVGGGPGGLMVAERLASAGCRVTLFEQMPSVGRKFLLAGRGGLNLTHSEPTADLVRRYGLASERLASAVEAFDAAALRAWADGLGEPTFVGSSGRVFPESFRATPLLRAWLARLAALGVDIRTRHRWTAIDVDPPSIGVVGPHGASSTTVVDAVVLACGGASWPKVGSDGAWVDRLGERGVGLAPLRPANCGFEVRWSDVFRERFAGAPLKNVALTVGDSDSDSDSDGDGATVRGEGVVTDSGVEGGVFYALGSRIRDDIERRGSVVVHLDLAPDLDVAEVVARLDRGRVKDSMSTALRKVGLSPVDVSLLREVTGNALPADHGPLASLVKAVPLELVGIESIDRAISTAGGVRFDEVDDRFMLRRLPGVFVVGEMLDWEAPTGGYLLQATFSTAVAASAAVLEWLERDARRRSNDGGRTWTSS